VCRLAGLSFGWLTGIIRGNWAATLNLTTPSTIG
jgi:hypothetical protein